ncbi:MAG TPA: DUF6325 family protein [Acidimicrobiia bacterium]|nr:DUF6325 family protein [Acidimicrobiia bacterium]
MPIGPVEYLIVAFPGNQFNGDIAPALVDLVESGTIRVLDLVFVAKDADGNVVIVEFDEHEGLRAFAEIDGEIGGVISHEDIEHATHDLPENSSAAVLVWEDVWAIPFAEAMRNSGAVLVEAARIPHDLIEPLMTDLASS